MDRARGSRRRTRQAGRRSRRPDLDDVLGVPLAGAGEVEAAEERRVVRDHDLRVHEVVHGLRRPRDRRLAAETAALITPRRSGIFHSLTPFVSHCPKTWSTCVSSTTPATGARPSFTTSTRVPRIGRMSTGDAIRTRSVPSRCASRSGATAPPRARGRTTRRSARRRATPAAGRRRPSPQLPAVPELPEGERVRVRDLGRAGEGNNVLLPRPQSSVQFVGPSRRLRCHEPRTCGASDPGSPQRRGSGSGASRSPRAPSREEAAPRSARGGRRCRGDGPPPRWCAARSDAGTSPPRRSRSARRRPRCRALSACARKPAIPRATSAARWPPSVRVVISIAAASMTGG